MNPQATRDVPASALAPSPLSRQFEDDLVALIPHLRAFSRMLCGKRAIAEDMAQEALAKAWRGRGGFEPGTNLKAWLFAILRNELSSHARRAWRETRWDSDLGESIPGPPREQECRVELSDTARALAQLPDAQRKALILIAAGGFSYGEAAQISSVPAGTLKSRVARARVALSQILDSDRPLPHRSTRRVAASQDIFAQLNIITRTGVQDDAVRA
jgi:RNA polymerase sigma-70 factor, ECF subfamily